MQVPISAEERLAGIAKIAASRNNSALVLKHLNELVRSTAFQGSHRSGQFLEYIVKKALAGRFESLKERIIGVELFGRDPSYDTGGDSIVRVTASDVRRRLLQHYGRYGAASAVRISLPTGSYIPEITFENHDSPDAIEEAQAAEPEATPTSPAAPAIAEPVPGSEAASQDHAVVIAPTRQIEPTVTVARRRWLLALIAILALNAVLWAFFTKRSATNAPSADVGLPWSMFFGSPRPLHLITSDPTIFNVQSLTGIPLSLTDYASHNYIPEPNNLSPEIKRIARDLVRGDKSSSAVDPPIAAAIAELTQSRARHIDVQAARNIQFSDLKSDDNFVFLGSPRSNPWTSLFSEQLDFRFAFDPKTGQENIVNVHPRRGEPPTYNPTAPGWDTGESYAIVAFVRNPDQSGQVLLIAGESGEGTLAAGRLVADMPRLATVIQKCGITSSTAMKHFELLLRLHTLAGSPHQVDIVACHNLP